MAMLKDLLLSAAVAASVSFVGNSFAESVDLTKIISPADIHSAANALVEEIKLDPNGNHIFPAKSAYKDLALNNDYNISFEGKLTTDSDPQNGHIQSINFSSIQFEAIGLPIKAYKTYDATISITADISADCKTLSNAKYTLIKGNGTLLDTFFQTDLNSYAHVVLDTLLSSPSFSSFCQTSN